MPWEYFPEGVCAHWPEQLYLRSPEALLCSLVPLPVRVGGVRFRDTSEFHGDISGCARTYNGTCLLSRKGVFDSAQIYFCSNACTVIQTFISEFPGQQLPKSTARLLLNAFRDEIEHEILWGITWISYDRYQQVSRAITRQQNVTCCLWSIITTSSSQTSQLRATSALGIC